MLRIRISFGVSKSVLKRTARIRMVTWWWDTQTACHSPRFYPKQKQIKTNTRRTEIRGLVKIRDFIIPQYLLVI